MQHRGKRRLQEVPPYLCPVGTSSRRVGKGTYHGLYSSAKSLGLVLRRGCVQSCRLQEANAGA